MIQRALSYALLALVSASLALFLAGSVASFLHRVFSTITIALGGF